MGGHVQDLHKRKDGSKTPLYGKGLRWRVVYDDAGKRRSRSFRTQDEARGFLTSVDHKQRAGEYVPVENRKALIGDLLPVWEASLIRHKPSTANRVRVEIKTTLTPKWADRQIGKLDRRDVQQWVHELHASGLAPRTVDTKYGSFRSFLNWCVSEGYLHTSPCVNIVLPRGHAREHLYLSPAQVRSLLDTTEEHHRPLVEFLVTTGARWGEACELRVKDLDLGNRRASLARSYTKGHVTLPKSHKRRSVPLTGPMVGTLARITEGKGREGLVFTTKGGFRVTVDNFRRLHWNDTVRAAPGVPDNLIIRDLRHTAASLAVSSGANVKAIQRMLGHASASLTLNTYSGLFTEDLDEVADRMGKLLDAPQRTEGTWPS